MIVSVHCTACGTVHNAPARAAGRTVNCLVCKAPMTVPAPEPEPTDPAAILLEDEPVRPAPPTEPAAPEEEAFPTVEPPHEVPEPIAARPRNKAKPIDLAALPPLTADEPPPWRRHLHWLLVLALLPLLISLLVGPKGSTIEERLKEGIGELVENIGDASPAERERFLQRLEKADTLDELLLLFPDNKLPGAFLSRSSLGHLVMAAVATVLFMAFFMFLASDGSANAVHVLFVGLFTATIGVGFLLIVQAIANAMGGRMFVGFNVVAIFFLVLKFIAFSYNAATDPEAGFALSFLGFTAGVGVCEEFVKLIPVFWHRSTENGRTWRGILIWGLASGAGFGIAEGIMYSSRYYNGVSGPGIYVVRFLSCVALHAIWSGSAATLLYIRRDLFDGLDSWHAWIFPTLFVIGVPAVLHGLYDTCLKKDMNGVALLTAVASFGYLAFLFSRLQTGDDIAANKAMLKEYQRRKAALR